MTILLRASTNECTFSGTGSAETEGTGGLVRDVPVFRKLVGAKMVDALVAGADGACNAYGGGVFITNNSTPCSKVSRSLDLLNWSEVNLPSSAYWQQAAYGVDRFICAGHNSTSTAYSNADGSVWYSGGNLPASYSFPRVIFGDGLFRVMDGAGQCATSTDGAVWTARTSSGLSLHVYGAGTWLAYSSQTTSVKWSIDNGVSWNAITMPFSIGAIVFGNDKFLCIQHNSPGVATSVDGKSFSTIATGNKSSVNISYALGMMGNYFVCANNYADANQLQISKDGAGWESIPAIGVNGCSGQIASNGAITLFGTSAPGAIWIYEYIVRVTE